jgi:hypothetical protein
MFYGHRGRGLWLYPLGMDPWRFTRLGFLDGRALDGRGTVAGAARGHGISMDAGHIVEHLPQAGELAQTRLSKFTKRKCCEMPAAVTTDRRRADLVHMPLLADSDVKARSALHI